MASSAKAAIYGLLVGAIGIVMSLTLQGASFEENFGLALLFKLRGPRRPPEEAVIITMDKDSANRLNLPGSPAKWPRSFHARLVNTLAEKKPAVIVFDLIFTEARLPEDDELFAKAILNSGNVILAEWLQTEIISVYDVTGEEKGSLHVEKTIPPLLSFGNCALASAPFILPKMPVKLNSYCSFLTGAEDTPTLPVLVFQVYALDVYDEFIRLLHEYSPSVIRMLPPDKNRVITEKNIVELMRILRQHFLQNPVIADNIYNKLVQHEQLPVNPVKNQLLKSLVRTYQEPKSRYLNFYGPPGTFPTVPYYQVLENMDRMNHSSSAYPLDFKGKVIFIGISEQMGIEQKDGFYTVFSQPDGLDISGVEIAATAFSNILENSHIQPVYPSGHLLIVGLWGLIIGVSCMIMPAIVSAGFITLLSIFYVWISHDLFSQHFLWLPLVIPVFFQIPAAFFGSVLWKYFTVNKERKNIRTAFGYYLPGHVADQLARGLKHIGTDSQLVYGTCMVTDGEEYTALSENMNPEDLKAFMNKYFEVIFGPVRNHSGCVLDIKGDSSLAIWATTHPDCKLRNLACQTALEIICAVNEFNRISAPFTLPTRIGIHSGMISLGHMGAIDHFEYRAAGDIVNTASRMEGLNKYLGTKILASAEVLFQLDGFLARNLGKFIFAGKSKPVEVFELICKIGEADSCKMDLCNSFSEAFDAYQNRYWEKAINLFYQSMNFENGNGPSRFYLDLCKNYQKNPPDIHWDGIVYLAQK